MKQILTLLSFFSLSMAYSQPLFIHNNLNNGNFTTAPGTALTLRTGPSVYSAVVQATTTASGRAFLFPKDGTFNPKWAASSATSIAKDTRLENGAVHQGGQDLRIDVTNANYYTFIIGSNTGSSNNLSVLETTFNPAITWDNLDVVTPGLDVAANSFTTAYIGQTIVLKSTTNRVLNAGEKLVIRYSTNGFSSSSFVDMPLESGTTYAGSIPAQAAGTTVNYYVFTTKNTITPTHADADYQALIVNNNNSSYTYTVNNSYGKTGGVWDDAATWLNGAEPPSGANVTIISGIVSLTDASMAGISRTVGNFTVNSGASFDGLGATLTLTSGSTLTNNANFSAVDNVSFAGAGTVAGSGTVNFETVTINGGVNFGTNSQLLAKLIIKSGGFVSTNAPTYNSGSTLIYDTGNSYGIGLEWANTNNPSSVAIYLGTTLTFNAITTNRTVLENLVIDGTLTLSSAVGGDLIVGGDFINHGTFNCNERSVTFKAIAALGGRIGGASATTFDYLVIDKVNAGTPFSVVLESNIIVDNALTFTTGYMDLQGNNLTLNSAATLTGTSPTQFIFAGGTGKLIRKSVGNTAKLFPIGSEFGKYSPVTITNAGTADDFSVNVPTMPTAPVTVPTKTVGIQWNISETVAGGSNATLLLQWNVGQEGTAFVRTNNIEIAHYSGSAWDYTLATVGGAGPYTATASGFTSFSPFIVANQNALAIDLTKFEAKVQQTATLLSWQTASEKDNALFQIERSANATDFSPIGEVKGAGNSAAVKNYTFTDATPLSGVNYYRLKAVDYSGEATISKVVSVNFTGKSDKTAVYPNPTRDVLRVEFTASDAATSTVQVTDLMGRVVLSQNVAVNKGANLLPLNVSALSSGAYFVKVNGDVTRFVKQ